MCQQEIVLHVYTKKHKTESNEEASYRFMKNYETNRFVDEHLIKKDGIV